MQQVLSVRESAMQLLQSSAAEDAAAPARGAPLTAGALAAAVCPAGEPAGCEVVEAGEGLEGAAHKPTACPLTGLTMSQIAELQKTPPEVLAQRWRGLTQRLE